MEFSPEMRAKIKQTQIILELYELTDDERGAVMRQFYAERATRRQPAAAPMPATKKPGTGPLCSPLYQAGLVGK